MTNCYIGITSKKEPYNGQCKSIFCKYDGYPEGGVGETLLRHYKNKYIIEKLMDCGEIPVLKETPNITNYFRQLREWEYRSAEIVSYSDFVYNEKSHVYYRYLFDIDENKWIFIDQLKKGEPTIHDLVDELPDIKEDMFIQFKIEFSLNMKDYKNGIGKLEKYEKIDDTFIQKKITLDDAKILKKYLNQLIKKLEEKGD